jgi:hypothetical protein
MRPSRVLAAGLLWLIGVAAARAEDAGGNWERAFPIAAAPPQVHFRARYTDEAGRAHRLEVWRQSDVRLRRTTDRAIDLYVEKSPSGEYAYRLIDHERKLLINADRTALYRIGVFSDWTSLAHVLEVPRGKYAVRPASRQSPASLRGECGWQHLERSLPAASASDVCWSSRWGLPLEIAIANDAGASRFSIEEVGTFAPGPEIFAIARDGLVEIDAGSEEEAAD